MDNDKVAERVTRALHPPKYRGRFKWVNNKPQNGYIEVFCSDWNKDHWAFYAYIGVDSYREDLKGINSLIERLNWRDGDVYVELIDHSGDLSDFYHKLCDDDSSSWDVLTPDIWENRLALWRTKMANLRAGITPYMSTGSKTEVTRLASEKIGVHANTWTRYVHVTLSKEGRLSIRVEDGNEAIVDVELPANEGQSKDAFEPTVATSPEIERETLKTLLQKYFGDDMAKSLLITRGIKGPLLEDYEDN